MSNARARPHLAYWSLIYNGAPALCCSRRTAAWGVQPDCAISLYSHIVFLLSRSLSRTSEIFPLAPCGRYIPCTAPLAHPTLCRALCAPPPPPSPCGVSALGNFSSSPPSRARAPPGAITFSSCRILALFIHSFHPRRIVGRSRAPAPLIIKCLLASVYLFLIR